MTKEENVLTRDYWVNELRKKVYRETTVYELADIIVDAMKQAINYSQCCKSDSGQLPNMTLEQAIAKAKPNLDKITDVDRHLEDIR